jgi:pilus assembly protein Flp/PilA
MTKFFRGLIRDERGISALEYAILAAIIIAVIVAGLTMFRTDITALFSDTSKEIRDATTTTTTPAN